MLIDRFVEGAVATIDVDGLRRHDVFVGAVMEHIEEAIHSGDPSPIPPATLSEDELDEIERITARPARRPGVRG